MASGGGLAVVGLAMTFAFTIQGNRLENDLVDAESDYSRENCSREPSKACDGLAATAADVRSKIDGADTNAKIGAAVLSAGLVAVAVGGIVYRLGFRKKQQEPTDLVGSLRVAPSLGGAALSGRF